MTDNQNSPAPGTPQTAHKAIVALLTGVVAVAAIAYPPITQIVSPEVIVAIATVVSTALVWLIPNKAKEGG